MDEPSMTSLGPRTERGMRGRWLRSCVFRSCARVVIALVLFGDLTRRRNPVSAYAAQEHPGFVRFGIVASACHRLIGAIAIVQSVRYWPTACSVALPIIGVGWIDSGGLHIEHLSGGSMAVVARLMNPAHAVLVISRVRPGPRCC